jgi:antitoxin component YwqK of YwqJK toxin-antitoxin module
MFLGRYQEGADMSIQDRFIQIALLALALAGAGMMISGFIVAGNANIASTSNPVLAVLVFLLELAVNVFALVLVVGGGAIFLGAFFSWYRRQKRLFKFAAQREQTVAVEGLANDAGHNLQTRFPIGPNRLTFWAVGVIGLGFLAVSAANILMESRSELLPVQHAFREAHPEGPFTVYYATGEKRVEGKYDADGYIQGKVTVLYLSGEIKRELQVSNGMLHIEEGAGSDFAEAIVDIYLPPSIKIEVEYDGRFIEWYEKGQKKIETNYADGQLNGPSTQWYDSGKLKSEQYYRDGRLEANARSWFENGQIAVEETYVKGRPSGISKSWWLDGQRLSEKVYTPDGHSTWKYWHHNGQQELEVSFVDTQKKGVFTRPYRLNMAENGQRSPRSRFEEQTVLDMPRTIPGRYSGPWTLWYETGQMRMQQYWDRGKQNGTCTYWYRSGQKRYEVNYRRGETNGPVRQWFENGQLKAERLTRNNRSDGHSRLWFENGQMKVDVSYVEGVRQPDVRQWDEAGTEIPFDLDKSYNYNPC